MLDEAKNINKSLSALGNVIAALSEGTVRKSNHITQLREYSYTDQVNRETDLNAAV